MNEFNINVLQAKDSDFFSTPRVYEPSKFDWVASVTVSANSVPAALEKAFRLTNSFDEFWAENEEVIAQGDAVKGCRSTSVGDILVADDLYFAVDLAGFKEINAA